MTELGAGIPQSCAWAIYTYRLRMIPAAARTALPHDLVPVGGSLLRRRSDARAPSEPGPPPAAIDNFW